MPATGTSLFRASVSLVVIALALSGCSGDDDGADGGTAGTGGDAGCDETRGCVVSKAEFQAQALNCPDDYDAALEELRQEPGEECISAFFDCDGLKGAAYQYGFTGDNVQCYYDKAGELVGGYRSSDHHAGTTFGRVPSPRCYTGPSCDDAGVPDGGTDEQRACEVSSDCVLTQTICCPCGEPAPNEIIGVHKQHAQAFYNALCPPPVTCPAIACPVPVARYVASCVAGRCEAIDLRDHSATECEQPSDCQVRATACCECGAGTDPGQLAAVSDPQAFSSLVCDPDQGCAKCAAVYPGEATATCGETNHCLLMDSRERF